MSSEATTPTRTVEDRSNAPILARGPLADRVYAARRAIKQETEAALDRLAEAENTEGYDAAYRRAMLAFDAARDAKAAAGRFETAVAAVWKEIRKRRMAK